MSLGNSGRQMDEAWKKAISEGKKGIHKVEQISAKMALAVLPKNDKARQHILGGITGAALGATGLGGAYTGVGIVGGAVVGKLNKIGLTSLINRSTKGIEYTVPNLPKLATKSAALKALGKVDHVTGLNGIKYPVGAKAGAKLLGKQLGTVGVVVGGVVGGIAGATDTGKLGVRDSLGKQVDNSLKKHARGKVF
jgi:hypothetical protein